MATDTRGKKSWQGKVGSSAQHCRDLGQPDWEGPTSLGAMELRGTQAKRVPLSGESVEVRLGSLAGVCPAPHS